MASTRVHFYNEALSRTTSTTTNYSTVKVSLVVTPNASKTYAIFWSVLIDGTSTTLFPKARLQNTTSATTLVECDDQLGDSTAATSRRVVGGVAIHTDAGSATAQTFQIQIASSTSSITVGASEACILALELIPSVDVWGSSAGVSTSALGAYVPKLTLSWTPASAGNYLVMFSATGSSISNPPVIRVNTTGGVISSLFNILSLTNWANWAQYIGGTVLASASGAQTAALEYIPWVGYGESEIRQAYGVALRLDEFANAFTDLDMTSYNTTSATYANAASVTGTPEASEYLILAFAALQSTDDSFSYDNAISAKTNVAGADIETTLAHLRPEGSGPGGGIETRSAWLSVRKNTATAVSTTWKTMYARTAGTFTVCSYNNVIAALQLESFEPTGPMRLWPDAIAASTNLTGTVSSIQDYPDAADANWLTATSATAATDLRVSFATPSLAPDGYQYFKYRVRKTTGSTTPTITVELRQANTLRKVLTRNVSVTSTTGQNLEITWHDTDLVSTLDGSDVELRLYSSPGYSNFSVGSSAVYSSTGTLLVSSAFLTYNEVSYPVTVMAGDLLVCQAVTRNLYMDSGASMSDPGWTSFAGNTYGPNTTRVHQSLFWRIADGTEGGGTVYVRTFGNNTSSMALVCIHRFTSTNGFASMPVETIGVDVGLTPTVTVSRTMTPSGLNQLAVCAIGLGENFTTFESMTGATGSTWTQRFYTGSSLESIGLQTANVSSGAAITGGQKTFNDVTDEYWSAVTFCVVPAPVGLTAVNTVEFGAIEWECTTVPSVSSSYTIATSTFN